MTIELPKRVAENIDRFTGREWILPKLLDWWDKSDERLFLLTGGTGTGKSMILAWLARFGTMPEDPATRAQLERVRKAVKAAHFCQALSRNISPQAFADSVANQLTATVQGFGDALAATLDEQVQIVGKAHADSAASGANLTGIAIGRIDLGTLGDELSFDRAFTQPLKKLYISGHSEPMLLLVDALDEAQTYTGVMLPDLLSRLVGLPAPVRILATTRDDPRVLKFFRCIRPVDLIKDADTDVDDVQTYAARRLNKLAAVEEIARQDFAQRLAQQASGVFLYAALLLDDLLERSSAQLPDLATYPLPKGLSGLYHEFLTRELGKDESRWFDVYEPLLGLIAVAQGEGLTAHQLTNIIGKDIRVALRASKQYLSGELPDGPFRPDHKSFADFLLEDKDNVDYHIDSQSMHRRVANYYWSKHHADWRAADSYALAHIAMHLGMAQTWPQLEELLLNTFFVRALSDLSNEALADAYRWALACLQHMPEGPRRKLLSQLSAAADQLRSFSGRAAEIGVIESFLKLDDSQHLLVVGPPGIGKSSLAALVWIRHFDQCLLAKLRPEDALLETFIKVVCDSPFLQGCVSQEEVEYLARFPSVDAYKRLFDLVARCKKNICFIIDELEVARDVDFEVREFPLLLPPNLRIIWVSRLMPGLLHHLTPVARLLDLDAMFRPDILDISRRLLGTKVRPDLVERIAELSQGNPLYVKLIVQGLDRGVLSEEKLPRSLWQLYEAHVGELETGYPEMRKRLASLVDVIASQATTAKVRLEDAAVQFDVKELDSIEASGLFVVERESVGTSVGVFHASLLDFLRERYALS